MLPIAIAAGVGSFAINAWAAYEKNEISEREYREAIKAARELELKLKTLRPDENWQDINPQLLQKAAEFVPDIASFVQENAPELITEAGAAAEKRIQRQALQKYAAQAETGRDVISEAQQEQALFEADAQAKQRQQALMQRLKQQGMLGTGAGLAAQLQSEQAAAQASRQESLRGVQEAEMRRRQALGEAASLAGQIRGQEFNVESANVQTMNSYNQRLANAKNLYNQYASGARNEAQLENQRREMARQSSNLQTSNQYALMNRQQALAARERARQFDVESANRLFDVRRAAEAGKYAADRQYMGDIGSAITSGIGTGIGAYGALSAASAAGASAAASGAKEAYFKSLLKSAGQGAAQGLAQSATRSAFAPTNPSDIEVTSTRPQYVLQSSQNKPMQLGWTPSSQIDTTPAYYPPGYGRMTPEEEEFVNWTKGGK